MEMHETSYGFVKMGGAGRWAAGWALALASSCTGVVEVAGGDGRQSGGVADVGAASGFGDGFESGDRARSPRGSSGVPQGLDPGAVPLGSSAGEVDEGALIPTRIRRLSNAEYNASVSGLLGRALVPAERFAPDARQNGFTVNEAQRVDPVLVKQLFASAEDIGSKIEADPDEVAPCSTPNAPEECAKSFIVEFGSRAYRRPLIKDERVGLLEVYRAGAEDGGYGAGVSLVVQAVLQSAGFLYLTELGDEGGSEGDAVALAPYELASALSYLVTGGPPDDRLLRAAESGELHTAEGRLAELRRLAEQDVSTDRQVQLIREWLELDRIATTDKDSNVYPQFASLRDAIEEESYAFVRAVLDPQAQVSGNDVATLLGANWTVAVPGLGELYPDAEDLGNGYLLFPERRGVLNQGAFLSVKAHAHESTPVLRGVLVSRRIACMDVPSPASLNLEVVPPVPDPSQTTRQRFEVHTADPQCAGCHATIDGFGNAFEQFDGMGMFRSTENGMPVDSTTTVKVHMEFDGDYEDSNELAVALANSESVRECFARHVFQAVAGRSDRSAADTEAAFLSRWHDLPAEQQGNVIDTLAAFVKSPLFTHRRIAP